MRERFKTTSTNNAEIVYVSRPDDWIYCPFCASKYGRQKKLMKALKRNGSVVKIECRFCKEEIEISI